MHFDALLAVVIARFMPEPLQIKVGPELAIDALEQIQIKRGSHTENVIVGRQHSGQIFHEVGAEKNHISRLQILPDYPEKTFRHRRLEISDRAAEKEDEHRGTRLS